VRLCSPGGALSLGAGRHTLIAATPGTFAVTDLSLTSTGAAPSTADAARVVTVGSWQPDQHRLSIGPGAASYLEVHQNYNPGWAATLNGQQLAPVRLDGWQQAFIVPAGAGGTITMTFRPSSTYHLVLIASMLAAALLLALAAWSLVAAKRRGAGPMVMRGIEAKKGRGWPGLLAVTALIFVAGGPVALAVPLLAYLAWRPRRWPGRTTATDPAVMLPVVAAAGMLAAGLLSAVRPFGGGLFGPFGWPAQACALVALAAALMPVVPGREPTTQEAPPAEEDR
jgi:arabinofuranan 3-O-arabinosyltransferase